jgi:hypothetical protein
MRSFVLSTFLLLAWLASASACGGSPPTEEHQQADAALTMDPVDGDPGSDVPPVDVPPVIDQLPPIEEPAPPVVDPPVPAPPPPTFQIISPSVTVPARSEITLCYYFRTSNTSARAIRQWTSRMTAGGRRVILFLTPGPLQPAGTLSEQLCGLRRTSLSKIWMYAAETLEAELTMPGDDGSGRPVGQRIKANHDGFVLMQFANPTDQAIAANVEVSAYAYDEGVEVTPAASFVTYNTAIDLPAAPSTSAPTLGSASGNCLVAPETRFFQLSTHTQKQAVQTAIRDGSILVYTATSWQDPGQAIWNMAPFHSFTSGKLSYQCDYKNPNNYHIIDGDNAAIDEICVASGYFFPAEDNVHHGAHYCLNSALIY